MYKGKALDKDETISLLAENMLVEKWLHAIDPRLRSHILQTKGSLFTNERPTLADNQLLLSDRMATILQELDGEGGPSIGRMGFAGRGRARMGAGPTYQPSFYNPLPSSFSPSTRGRGAAGRGSYGF